MKPSVFVGAVSELRCGKSLGFVRSVTSVSKLTFTKPNAVGDVATTPPTPGADTPRHIERPCHDRTAKRQAPPALAVVVRQSRQSRHDSALSRALSQLRPDQE